MTAPDFKQVIFWWDVLIFFRKNNLTTLFFKIPIFQEHK